MHWHCDSAIEPCNELLLAKGQAVGCEDPWAQKLFAGHTVQLALPPADLYVPGAQGEHAEPSGPVKPG